MRISNRSLFFVTVQFSAILFLFLLGDPWPAETSLLIVELLAIAYGAWAIQTMRFRVNITPEVLPDSELITYGPYGFVRHPMYLSIIITTLVWIISQFTLLNLIIWIVLVINLLIKIDYEERLLKTTFSNYIDYAQKTKRLIPLIY